MPTVSGVCASGVRVRPDELVAALRVRGVVGADAVLRSATESPIGIGHTADTLLIRLGWEGEGPDRVVAKIPSLDAGSAATATSLGAYEREARFYSELAPRTSVSLPRLLGVLPAQQPTGVLLEDLSGLDPADQLSPQTLDRVHAVRRELAALQAPFWEDADLAGAAWLHRRLGVPIPGIHARMQASWAATEDRLALGLDDDERTIVRRFVTGADAWAQSLSGPMSLTHHDFRVDNMLFGPAGRIVVLDWQTVGWGPPMFDLAYFLGTSLDCAGRRQHERAQVAAHVDDLAGRGVSWDHDDAWTAYRQASFAVLLMLLPATGSVRRTDRGDAMFRHLIRQGARMALDLGADEFLPVEVT